MAMACKFYMYDVDDAMERLTACIESKDVTQLLHPESTVTQDETVALLNLAPYVRRWLSQFERAKARYTHTSRMDVIHHFKRAHHEAIHSANLYQTTIDALSEWFLLAWHTMAMMQFHAACAQRQEMLDALSRPSNEVTFLLKINLVASLATFFVSLVALWKSRK